MDRYTFLMDMFNYYGEDTTRRARNAAGNCMYLTTSGKKCAIGRYIPDDAYYPSLEGLGACDQELLSILPEEVAQLQTEESPFLSACQITHDNDSYWQGVSGLTPEGEKRFCYLVNKYLL